MKTLPRQIEVLLNTIRDKTAHKATIRIMEVCGTHTVSIMRHGIKSLLPPEVKLISGPGCPVCVTCQGYIDAAISLSQQKDLVICTYGDMVRVPGHHGSLARQRAVGGDIRVVMSPLDMLKAAQKEPAREFVFLAIGFETTAPATAAAVLQARQANLKNVSFLCAHKWVMPALEFIAGLPDLAIDAFLCPGHVSIVIGADAYQTFAHDYHKPCVITGFEPLQILQGIEKAVTLVVEKRPEVVNAYPQVVRPEGNPYAQKALADVFESCPAPWRAIGSIPNSGMRLKPDYRELDAALRYQVDTETDDCLPGCRCGEVIMGKIEPPECALFGKRCTPGNPVGPCMVSSEGTCAAWFKYGNVETQDETR